MRSVLQQDSFTFTRNKGFPAVLFASSSFVRKLSEVSVPFTMASPPANSPEWWTSGRTGTLSPWSQALVYAFIKVGEIKELKIKDVEIAEHIYKVGGSRPSHPSANSIRVLREKIQSDPHWHPGKQSEDAGEPGRPKTITKQQQNALAKAAMSIKEKGQEPTVAAVIAQCPVASLNKETGQTFTDKVILEVFRTRCYDSSPDSPWNHVHAKQKTALTPELMELRCTWGNAQLAQRHHCGWYFRHCMWMDPCSTIIPGRAKTQHDQQFANFGKGKRWISEDSKDISRNLRASPYGGKQKQWGDERVWWFVLLVHGRVHVEVMPEDWVQNGQGQATMVNRLPSILGRLLRGTGGSPTVVCTDRGPGFYHPRTGDICREYAEALAANGYTAWAGESASHQPADIPDVLLHETAVAWIRSYLKHNPIKIGPNMAASRDALEAALKDAAAFCNDWYEVKELCHDFPKRLKELIAGEGERLRH